MASCLRVAVVQTGGCTEDVAKNRALLLEHFRREATPDTDLVVFPELATTPYFCAATRDPVWAAWAEPIPGPTTTAFAEIARETRTAVCFGMFERGADGRGYNAAPIIGADGELVVGCMHDGVSLTAYRKCALPRVVSPNLTTDEKHWFDPGPGPAVFEVGGLRVGVIICYDRSFSDLWTAYAALRVDVVVAVVSSFGWREELFVAELRLRAMEFGLWVVAANRGGLEELRGVGLSSFGQSCVIAPTGHVVAEAPPHTQPCVVRATIDTDALTDARAAFPVQADRRPELTAFAFR